MLLSHSIKERVAEQEQTTQNKGNRKELIFNEADEEEEEVSLWQLQSNCG